MQRVIFSIQMHLNFCIQFVQFHTQLHFLSILEILSPDFTDSYQKRGLTPNPALEKFLKSDIIFYLLSSLDARRIKTVLIVVEDKGGVGLRPASKTISFQHSSIVSLGIGTNSKF